MRIHIVYVHGFRSSHDSNTVKLLKKYLHPIPINKDNTFYFHTDDYPINPFDAINQINNTIDYIHKEFPNELIIVIGTSLGGYFVERIYGEFKILINPATEPNKSFSKYVNPGTYIEYYSERKDGNTHFEITKKDIDDFVETNIHPYIEHLDIEEQYLTYGLFGINDTVINNQNKYKKYYTDKNFYTFDGGHQIDESNIESLIEIINKVISDYILLKNRINNC